MPGIPDVICTVWKSPKKSTTMKAPRTPKQRWVPLSQSVFATAAGLEEDEAEVHDASEKPSPADGNPLGGTETVLPISQRRVGGAKVTIAPVNSIDVRAGGPAKAASAAALFDGARSNSSGRPAGSSPATGSGSHDCEATPRGGRSQGRFDSCQLLCNIF